VQEIEKKRGVLPISLWLKKKKKKRDKKVPKRRKKKTWKRGSTVVGEVGKEIRVCVGENINHTLEGRKGGGKGKMLAKTFFLNEGKGG